MKSLYITYEFEDSYLLVFLGLLKFARGSMEECLGSVGVRWKVYSSFSGVGQVR